jgi:hypothetical protein
LPCRFRCRIRGALLPHLFTLAAPKPRRAKAGRFVLCGTVPGVAPAGRYPAPHVDGARTFLSRSLSTVAGAAVRPTDAIGMGLESPQVKPITPPRDGRKKLSRRCRSAAGSFDFMSANYAEDLGAIRRGYRRHASSKKGSWSDAICVDDLSDRGVPRLFTMHDLPAVQRNSERFSLRGFDGMIRPVAASRSRKQYWGAPSLGPPAPDVIRPGLCCAPAVL